MFIEIADRVWVARYEWFDVNITLIGGDRGLVAVDTNASTLAGAQVVRDAQALGVGSVVAVVNTHEHFDHTFGNAAFLEAYGDLPIHAHEWAAEHTQSAGDRIKSAYADDADDPHRDEVLATTIVPAKETFSSASILDLGDRQLELVYPGRGHTAGDLIVRVPDADVVVAGDLIEESAQTEGTPGFGADCYPLEWPQTLDLVLGLLTANTRVVPGHGAVVDKDFVFEQRSNIGIVAETIRDLASRGVPVAEALDAGDWPFPEARLGQAVARGYELLPRNEKRLPLA